MFAYIQEQDFDQGELYAQLQSQASAKTIGNTGAIVTFTGLVRDFNNAGDIDGIELEHYPGMTEKALEDICNEAAQRWKISGLTVIHRVGRLFPGDNIVLVLVSSKHRGDAYNSNEFIMDFLKSKAPIWKKETSKVGSYWVGARTSDIDSLKAWIKS